jgi:uncharacterized protein YegL
MSVVRPGGELATRPLHFIFIADCSTSMKNNGKIDVLNQAIREAIPHMRRVAEENPNAEVLVRAISFSSGAKWHVASPTAVDAFEWEDLTALGVTDMGKAFELLADALAIPPMSERALPPVLVLISDGQPTDQYADALRRMLAQPWGVKAVKLAIAIGQAANHRVLKEFVANESIEVLQADRAAELVAYIKWASTAVLKAASSPASQASAQDHGNVIIPQIPADFWEDMSISIGDVW